MEPSEERLFRKLCKEYSEPFLLFFIAYNKVYLALKELTCCKILAHKPIHMS